MVNSFFLKPFIQRKLEKNKRMREMESNMENWKKTTIKINGTVTIQWEALYCVKYGIFT